MTEFIATVRGTHHPFIPESWEPIDPVNAHLVAPSDLRSAESPDSPHPLERRLGGYVDPFARTAERYVYCNGDDSTQASWDARRKMRAAGFTNPRVITIRETAKALLAG